MKKEDKDIVGALQKFDLTPEEAQIYFELVKSGPSGAIVKDLVAKLPFERTTIYSIFKRLIKKECISPGGNSKRGKHATLFVARDPSQFFQMVIEQHDQKLQQLRDLREKHENVLLRFFQKSVSFSPEDVDPLLIKYVKPLLDKKWKITSYEAKTRTSLYDYYNVIYHLFLEAPRSFFYPEAGVILFVFDDPLKEDEIGFQFFMRTLQKKNREEVLNSQVFTHQIWGGAFSILDLKVTETTHEIKGHPYPGFNFTFILDKQVSPELLQDPPFVNSVENVQALPGGKMRLDYGQSIIIPEGKHIFYLWAETMDLLLEMVDAIQAGKIKPVTKSPRQAGRKRDIPT